MAEFAVQPKPIERTGDDSPATSLMRYVWRMSGRHQIWICLVALFVASISLLPLELQRRIIDDAIRNSDVALLVSLAGVFLAVLAVNAAGKFVLRMYQAWLSESVIRYNREHLAGIHRRRRTAKEGSEGQAVSVIGPEIDRLGGFVGEGLSQPVVNVGMLLVIAGYMLAVEPLVTAFSMIFLVPQVIVVPIVQRYINKLLERRVTMVRGLSDRLVQPPAPDGGPSEDLTSDLDGIYGNRMRTMLFKFGLKAFVGLLNALAPLSVLAIGGYLVIQGETTIGVVVAFISGFDRMATPLRELIAYYRLASQANVQHKMIAEWMS